MLRKALIIGQHSTTPEQIGADIIDSVIHVIPKEDQPGFIESWARLMGNVSNAVYQYYFELHANKNTALEATVDEMEAIGENISAMLEYAAQLPPTVDELPRDSDGLFELMNLANEFVSYGFLDTGDINKIADAIKGDDEIAARYIMEQSGLFTMTALTEIINTKAIETYEHFAGLLKANSGEDIKKDEEEKVVEQVKEIALTDAQRTEIEKEQFRVDKGEEFEKGIKEVVEGDDIDPAVSTVLNEAEKVLEKPEYAIFEEELNKTIKESPETPVDAIIYNLIQYFPKLGKVVKEKAQAAEYKSQEQDIHKLEKSQEFHPSDISKKPFEETQVGRPTYLKSPKLAFEYAQVEGPADDTRMTACENPEYAYNYAKDIDGSYTEETWNAVKGSEFMQKYIDSGIANIPAEEIAEAKQSVNVHEERSATTSALIDKNKRYDKTMGEWELDKDANALRRRKIRVSNAMKGLPAVPYSVGDKVAFSTMSSFSTGTVKDITKTSYILNTEQGDVEVVHDKIFDPAITDLF